MNDPAQIVIVLFVLLFSVIVHEVAHGWTALRLGDPTAYRAGRLTLNPIPHIDPFMTVLLPALLIMSGTGFLFGGAKPVPYDPRYLKRPRRDSALIALAGPASNVALALISVLALWLSTQFGLIVHRGSTLEAIQYLFVYGLQINLILAWFNLMPLPPLDGSKVLAFAMSREVAYRYFSLERYGLFILFGLIAVGGVRIWLSPAFAVFSGLLGWLS